MKVLVSWLKDFIDVAATADDIAAAMSVRGFAVEGIDHLGDDAVIDFEVTANRPDCLSVIGMAREVACAYGVEPPRDPALAPLTPVERSDIDVALESPALCSRFAGAVADVAVGASPEWMQTRLRASGVRPISNIVDITNYVMLELGQPMHAYDLARIDGARFRVRIARPGEMLTTLDGQRRELTSDMLVIADAQRPVGIGGVMGGADSEVSADSRSIALEAAYFDPRSVRQTSKRLGLKTEASVRFERGADPAAQAKAIQRACALIESTGAGKARGTIVDRRAASPAPTACRLRRGRIAALLGAPVPDDGVDRILTSLGFAVRSVEEGWDVDAPTWRVDVLREVDLIEEVARYHGFDRLASTFPPLTTATPPMDPRIEDARRLRTLLTGAGLSEAVTFGFISARAAAPFAAADDIVPIANPLSESFAVLRPSALPGLLDGLAHNRNRQQSDVRLFEIGNVFSRTNGERRVVACAWTGAATEEHWSGGRRDVDFFDVKGLVERICRTMRAGRARAESHRESWLVPGRAATLEANGHRVAVLGQIAPEVLAAHRLPEGDPVYVAEVDLDALDAVRQRGDLRVEALPRFPSVTRDVSVLLDEAIPAEAVRDSVRRAAPDTLVRVREFDRYQGKGVPAGKISLSLRLTFRSAEATLTDAEVQAAMDRILGELKNTHGAIQR